MRTIRAGGRRWWCMGCRSSYKACYPTSSSRPGATNSPPCSPPRGLRLSTRRLLLSAVCPPHPCPLPPPRHSLRLRRPQRLQGIPRASPRRAPRSGPAWTRSAHTLTLPIPRIPTLMGIHTRVTPLQLVILPKGLRPAGRRPRATRPSRGRRTLRPRRQRLGGRQQRHGADWTRPGPAVFARRARSVLASRRALPRQHPGGDALLVRRQHHLHSPTMHWNSFRWTKWWVRGWEQSRKVRYKSSRAAGKRGKKTVIVISLHPLDQGSDGRIQALLWFVVIFCPLFLHLFFLYHAPLATTCASTLAHTVLSPLQHHVIVV
eukprot:Hpha_TRINITY_DN12101_c0_g2::TRINITY_DN12101_c0_g2_i1::g.81959::m.81959